MGNFPWQADKVGTRWPRGILLGQQVKYLSFSKGGILLGYQVQLVAASQEGILAWLAVTIHFYWQITCMRYWPANRIHWLE
jgi:hypothetical protein